ncbi:Golgi integral membrane protein 4-like [Agrilus planipennis]|uniref:Golgi integral membrane protein 4-like n=1 Tax=Agrilus planipennis TaxID=224129 RepID=A0A1W4WM87_AGRPL|nr:Golgi integral membrane protein 4-like [Agrilus planipennis]
MTTSRAVRGTKGRIFVYICVVLMITGVVVCYNSTLSQLDDIRKAKDQCHQQQENLSTQLQVIFDYKQRLEKSLKTEKAEHQQTKSDLEKKLADEKIKSEKIVKDDELQLSALKQNYKLLKTQHEDFKTRSTKTEEEQLNQINVLKEKLKKLELDHEEVKAQLLNLKHEKEKLEEQLKQTNTNMNPDSEAKQIRNENNSVKLENKESKHTQEKDLAASNTRFSKQISRGDAGYEIRNNGGKSEAEQMDIPNNENKESENVLAAPNKNLQSRSSTKTTILKSKVLDDAQPINVPTITPGSIKSSPETNNFVPMPYGKGNLPNGVVPPPNSVVEQQKEDNNNHIKQDIKETFPERYRSNIENQKEPSDENKIKEAQLNDIRNHLMDTKDENNAIEDVDSPPHKNNQPYDPAFALDNNQNNIDKDKPEHEHIMRIKPNNFDDPAADYDRNGHDAAIEEEEDDDLEDYGNGMGNQKEPAVRH